MRLVLVVLATWLVAEFFAEFTETDFFKWLIYIGTGILFAALLLYAPLGSFVVLGIAGAGGAVFLRNLVRRFLA